MERQGLQQSPQPCCWLCSGKAPPPAQPQPATQVLHLRPSSVMLAFAATVDITGNAVTAQHMNQHLTIITLPSHNPDVAGGTTASSKDPERYTGGGGAHRLSADAGAWISLLGPQSIFVLQDEVAHFRGWVVFQPTRPHYCVVQPRCSQVLLGLRSKRELFGVHFSKRCPLVAIPDSN